MGERSDDTCHAHGTPRPPPTPGCAVTPPSWWAVTHVPTMDQRQECAVTHVLPMYHAVPEPRVWCYTPLSRRIVTHVYLAQMSTLPCKHLPIESSVRAHFAVQPAFHNCFMTALLLFETPAWSYMLTVLVSDFLKPHSCPGCFIVLALLCLSLWRYMVRKQETNSKPSAL